MDDLLLSWTHCTKAVEEVSSPHDLGNHDHLINQSVSISDQLPRLLVLQAHRLLLRSLEIGVALEFFKQKLKLTINSHWGILLLLCSLFDLLRGFSESLEQLLCSIW